METTEAFKAIIWNYLLGRAEEDEGIAQNLYKEGKSIEGCVAYILSEVKKSGQCGFADEEIFSMAVHYYDEDNLSSSLAPCGGVRIVVNETMKATTKSKASKSEKAKGAVIENLLFGDDESED